MKTTLPPKQIAELRLIGVACAATSPFVDPSIIPACKRVLARRGQDWAESVLGRDLSRRSRISLSFPWLDEGEPEALVFADDAEKRAGR